MEFLQKLIRSFTPWPQSVCAPDIMILDQAVILFTRLLYYTKWQLEKGDNSAKYEQNFAKIQSGHLHVGHNLYAK